MGFVAYVMGYIDISTSLVAVTIFILSYLWLFYRRLSSFPPGPTPLPIIGNIPFAVEHELDMCKELIRMKPKYGDVVTIFMGNVPVVFLSSYESIKEALLDKGHAFVDRVDSVSDAFYGSSQARPGIAQSSGERWKKIRRKVIAGLRDMGVGKKTIENKIIEEAGFVIDEIEKNGSKLLTLKKIFNYSVSNIINGVVFGERFDYADKGFQQSIEKNNKVFQMTCVSDPLLFSPKTTLLYTRNFKRVKLLDEITSELFNFYAKKIQEHRESFNKGEIRDIIDLCLESAEDDEDFQGGTIVGVVDDLFGAGSETTYTTLTWLFLNILRNPDIQEKCYREIEEVFGSETPSYDSLDKCHYINATLNENQRFANIFPFTLPHFSNEKTTVRGYTIPHGTTIICNLYSVHNDEDNFKDARKFKPERWLDKNGNFRKLDKLIPFGMGKRICAGENLAKMEIFLFFTTMLQRFQFLPKEGAKLPEDDQRVSGGIIAAPYYEVVAVPR